LNPKDLRDEFYERLSLLLRTFQLAMSSDEFYNEFSADQVDEYRKAIKSLEEMRRSVQLRYAEAISYKEYEPRVRKLLDTYVEAHSIEYVTPQVNIFDQSTFQEAVQEYGKTPASKADMIAHLMKKVISENMEKDEAYYKKFSELIEETINAFHEGRIDERIYLERVMQAREDMKSGYQEGIPDSVRDHPQARAFFGALSDVLLVSNGKEKVKEINESLATAGLEIAKIVEGLTIVDWKRNRDVQRKMENQIEDFLMEHRKDMGLEMTFDEIDEILTKCLKVAKNNY
jgi:type I restriction enzyme R subunit